ncbi:sugar phosphate nucleotidyltransferase [Thermospira aquatica]|uniref:NTP transferase domain-containing protein n=1 Tax=Thermospira aquatica TaxID=2828656 RepID=A0AAX3BFM4_9SPIR|nr:sugar phosphate nucleotidyltransferase [Thermospira aquatica]URA11182.1 NTP transferase domain-containing protein [Thermospira aquatica]
MENFSRSLEQTIAFILGGGRGQRLYPLTKFRAKPAVPFAGNYRLIDIPVSNCIHSGVHKIYIMTQFQSASLNRHIMQTYKLDIFREGFVDILASELSFNPAESGFSEGTADAVRKGLKHIEHQGMQKSYVLILAGDQLYRMDYRKILRRHLDENAQVTLAVLPIKRQDAERFGLMQIKDGRVINFKEKPKAEDIPPEWYRGERLYGSMGIYLFDLDFLKEVLYNHPEWQDFGKQVLPGVIAGGGSVVAYEFTGYWEDIGTVASFHEAHLGLVKKDPVFDLYQADWPFFFKPRFLPPARLLEARVSDSLVSDGVKIESSEIRSSVIGIRTLVEKGAQIEESVIMGADYFVTDSEGGSGFQCVIGAGSVIQKAIIDKNCRIGRGVRLTNEHRVQHEEGDFYSIVDGIIVIPKNTVVPDGTII